MRREPKVHGNATAYHWHNQNGSPVCEACRNWHTKYMCLYRKRVILNRGNLMRDSAGTRRRLMGLCSIGYSFVEIAERLGVDRSIPSGMASRSQTKVYPDTAEKIRAIYEELSMLPPGNDWLHVRNARLARERGYPSPLAWDDDTIDDPHTLPMGLPRDLAYNWYWKAASDIERIEWILEHGPRGSRRFWR